MSGVNHSSVSHSPDSVLEGGCHCQSIRFRITVQSDQLSILDCNCTICTKKGYLHLIVPQGHFQLLRPAQFSDAAIGTYTFGTHTAKHHFCTVCGITPYYRARSHPDDYDVNVRCLDDYYAVVDKMTVTPFDGRENWEKAASTLRQRLSSASVMPAPNTS